MPKTLDELSKKIGVSISQLQKKAAELGFALKEEKIDNDLADLLIEELQKTEDKTKVYDILFDREIEKEIIKTQRKKTAGKPSGPIKPSARKPLVGKKEILQTVIEISDLITIKELSEKTGVNAIKIIGELMKNGILANINQQIDFETASIVADDLGIKLKKKRAQASVEDLLKGNLRALLKEDEEELKEKPPIVTVMGHVDHGKTKLLDAIRQTDVASKEAGGITQHIGAYQVEKDGKKITFIDTPGHEAFTAMRARGAKVTDIVILVIAADEGIKPQTIEALNHAKEAKVPIIVAINKIDKEGANADRVKTQIAELGLQPEDWGGNTPVVSVSALTNQGIPDLLQTILIVAELQNLKANPNREAVCTIIEAHLDKNLGPVATVIVNTGTLKISDNIVVGSCYGKIKIMRNHLNKNTKEALPSMPIMIAGLSKTPEPGDILQVVKTPDDAKQKAFAIETIRQHEGARKISAIESIISQIKNKKLKLLKIILKADTNGSLEALKNSLLKIKTEEVSVSIIHSGIGNITESDIMMAKASEGMIIGFSITASRNVRKLAEEEGIQIFTYTVIYQAIEDIKNLLAGLLEPEIIINEIGKAKVLKIFMTGKKEMIAGCRITEGKLIAKSKLRVKRNEKLIGEGILSSLRDVDKTVPELTEGHECGVKFTGNVKLQEDDILEAFQEELKKRSL